MTHTTSRLARGDFVPVLHNCGPSTHSVYRTGAVGTELRISPVHTVQLALLSAGVPQLPDSTFTAHDRVHLHPDVVVAGVHATLELIAQSNGAPLPLRDADLFERLSGGRQALGAASARCTEMALAMLAEVHRSCASFGEGTRFHGVSRWDPVRHEPDVSALHPEDDVRGQARLASLCMTMLGWAAPPLVSHRRTPSLEYFRTDGTLRLRSFGPWVAA